MGKLGVSKLVVIAAVIGVAAALIVLINVEEESPEPEISNLVENPIKKAAIIDQLHDELPNEDWQKKVKDLLYSGGYEQIDLFTTEDVTVDFYRELPSMGYQFIVARTHSLAIKEPQKQSVWMFTGEKYTEDKYIQEQLAGQVSRGVPFLSSAAAKDREEAERQRLFIVGSKFVDEEMTGRFPGTTFVLGGCDTMSYPFMAKSLVNRGASAVIGWYGLVSLFDNDRATLKVIEEILINGQDPDDAVKYVMEYYDGAMQYRHSKMRQYSTGASTFDI